MPQTYTGADWTCPTCAVRHATHFCPACGEESTRKDHLTLRGFGNQLLTAVTSVDSQLLRSFRTLLFKPGALTAAYREGQRKRYLLPINLFLFANVIFFAVQSAASVKVFSTPLDLHLHNQFWSPVASHLLEARLQAKGITLQAYAPAFDQAVALHAKTLIGLMVPVFALFLPPIFFKSRQPFVVHAVFALHTYSFILMMLCAVLSLLSVLAWLGFDPASPVLDQIISIAQLMLLFVYLFIAVRTIYGVGGVARIACAFALTTLAGALLLGYRFFLFVFTLYAS